MSSADGRYTIVFNGEIYNFVELRAELEGMGEVFRGRSDTEVLLRLFAREGIRCVQKLNGMFAFAIYDKAERAVWLVRDRLGVKPLFYWIGSRQFAFTSELRGLRGLPDVSSEVDPEVVGIYLRLGVVPDWACIHPRIRKLPPGCWMRVDLEATAAAGPVSYWDLPPVGAEEGRGEDEWVDEIEALLWDATRIRLRSDVPVGVFLSGGIDSALVAAAASKQSPGLTALTIGFPGAPEDETMLALSTARHLGLNTVVRNVDWRDGLQVMPLVMAHFDEPFADTSALPTSLVCREARREVTVALSGDGGDEVFAGYPNYVQAWQWRFCERVPLPWRQTVGRLLERLSPADSKLRRFSKRLGQPVGRFGLGGLYCPFQDWQDECLKSEFNVSAHRIIEMYKQHLQDWRGASSVDLAQRTDLRTFLLEDILVKVDRMSMMHSLEVRSPFLDYRLVELGLKVPAYLRVRHGVNKYLLRRLADRHLPRPVCRAPKRGFSIPLGTWLRAPESGVWLRRELAPKQNGFPDPLEKGRDETLWRLGITNAALLCGIERILAYRWWAEGLKSVFEKVLPGS